MLRVRVNTGSSSSSVMEPSDDYDERSAVWQFVEEALPIAGLWAEALKIDACHESEGGHNLRGLRLYRVHKVRTSPMYPTYPAVGVARNDLRVQAAELAFVRWRAVGRG